MFRKKKKRVGKRWRLDETYIRVKGQWKYYYRAVDKTRPDDRLSVNLHTRSASGAILFEESHHAQWEAEPGKY